MWHFTIKRLQHIFGASVLYMCPIKNKAHFATPVSFNLFWPTSPTLRHFTEDIQHRNFKPLCDKHITPTFSFPDPKFTKVIQTWFILHFSRNGSDCKNISKQRCYNTPICRKNKKIAKQCFESVLWHRYIKYGNRCQPDCTAAPF